MAELPRNSREQRGRADELLRKAWNSVPGSVQNWKENKALPTLAHGRNTCGTERKNKTLTLLTTVVWVLKRSSF